jgi:FkbM family methyltransferase
MMLDMAIASLSNVLHRVGIHVQRYHDPYEDAARLFGSGVKHAVDGGAHHGNTVARLLSIFPKATVDAFEPQDGPFQIITSRLQSNPRVRIHKKALTDYDGTATFYINRPNQSSLLKTLDPVEMQSTGTTQEVAAIRLDTWSKEQGIVPEFMKFDLQGNELAALRGASHILKNGVRGVLTEVNFQPRYESCTMFHEVGQFLFEYGFALYRCYDLCGTPNGYWQQADAMYIKK